MKSGFKALVVGVALLASMGGVSQLQAEQGDTNAPPVVVVPATNAPSTNALPATYSGYVFDQYQWIEASDLPKGARMAIMESNPSKAGLYTVRYKLPAGYRIPLSWTTTDERITVISGLLNIGISPDYAQSSSKAVPAGGFAFIPANMRFTAWTDTETVIQVHGIGPSELRAVFPSGPGATK